MATTIQPSNPGVNAVDDDVGSEAWEATKWHSFLEKEVDDTRQVFLRKPKFLLSHVRGERQIAHDYAGRELLELLQNAADAAAEIGGNGRVRIEIARDGLLVANSGQPFRSGGVQSLMTPHASDKPGRKAMMIGAKGLGFRSLLNWSHEPVISSGALEIVFSVPHATSIIAGLKTENAGIARLADKEEEPLVPVLAFPAFSTALDSIGGASAQLLLRVRALRSANFDTVVAAPFEDAEAFDRAVTQANEFEPNFLLFVEALTEIELLVEGRPAIRWRRSPIDDDSCELEIEIDGQVTSEAWICVRKRGELAVGAAKKQKSYELAVAFAADGSTQPGALHSYFPTSLPLPFPALFHATLELDSNRKAMKENSDANDRVLKSLAAFYAETLLRLLRVGRIKNALDYLKREEIFAQPLRSFETGVYKAARLLALVPILGGRRVSAVDAKLGPPGYETYLPTRHFSELAKCRDQTDRALLGRLEVSELPAIGVVKTLRTADLTIDERARAIAGVARSLPKQHHVRSLLLDRNGRPMAGTNTPFPPPMNDQSLPKLPDWAKAKFIHPDLWKALQRHLDGTTPREKLRRLSGFGVVEYSNEAVIASVRSQAAEALAAGRRDPDTIQRELLQTVYALFSPDNRNPPGSFKVMSADGAWRDAREVHLSESYGRPGQINSALYSHAPAQLLARPDANGLCEGADNAAEFFKWIGVEQWPRVTTVPVPVDLRPVVQRSLPPTIVVKDGTTHQSFPKRELSWTSNFIAECKMIVGLDEILANANSDAILSWLAHDPRFDPAWPHVFKTIARGRKDGKANYRDYNGILPDLVRERIASAAWLACRDGGRHAPRAAMVQATRLQELFASPRPPEAVSETVYGLTLALWRNGLDRAGVPETIADLSEARIFSLLAQVAEQNASEEVVRRLYLQVLELSRFDEANAEIERADFLSTGRVQVHKGHKRQWVSPSEALYAEHSGFPAAAREFIALIDLPPRKGKATVLSRFGVNALNKERFRFEVASLVEDAGVASALLRASLNDAKPYIRALRISESPSDSRIKRFEEVDLKIVKLAELAVTIDDQRIVGPMETWTHIWQGDTLIVAIDPVVSTAQMMALAHEAVADGLAEFFQLQSGGEFTKLLAAQDDGLRLMLLRRMLPQVSPEEFDLLLNDASILDEPYPVIAVEPHMLVPPPSAAPPVPVNAAQAVPSSTGPASGATPSPPTALSANRSFNPAAITATPIVAAPPPSPSVPAERRTLRLRISRPTGPTSALSAFDIYQAGDAEEWTRLFEVEQGRFPVDVAHLQGREAYGCDCLSFATADDRTTFEGDPKRTDLVVRFIETKSGIIELTENEARAAAMHRDRYYIYRVQFIASGRGAADLTISADPLSQRDAMHIRHEFRIDDAAESERFRLTPDAD